MRSSGPAAGGFLRWDDPATVQDANQGAQTSHNTSAIVAGGKRCFNIILVSLRGLSAAMIEGAAGGGGHCALALSVEDFWPAVLIRTLLQQKKPLRSQFHHVLAVLGSGYG
jgi:hypothetical protein